MRTFSSRRYLEELMAELDRAAISERLQQSRKQAGVTQDEMAEVMRVHVNSIQNWESTRLQTVPFDRMDEWAAITGTTKAWLLQGEEIRQPATEDQDQLLREILARLDSIERRLGDGS